MDPPDGTLWELAGTGDAEAFGQLFDRHARAVYNHCFRLTASWSTAAFHDRYGYLIEVVTAQLEVTCDMSPTGTVLNGSGGSRDPGLGSEPGYVTRPGIAIEVTAYGSDTPAKGMSVASAAGHVRKGVARVVVTWRGRPPVTAVLDGPFFLARTALPARPGGLPPGIAVAYDAAGHKVGTSKVFS